MTLYMWFCYTISVYSHFNFCLSFPVCSTTLWFGHLAKNTSEEELRELIEEYGTIRTINVSCPLCYWYLHHHQSTESVVISPPHEVPVKHRHMQAPAIQIYPSQFIPGFIQFCHLSFPSFSGSSLFPPSSPNTHTHTLKEICSTFVIQTNLF